MLEELCRDAMARKLEPVTKGRFERLMHSGKWNSKTCRCEYEKIYHFVGGKDRVYTQGEWSELPIVQFSRKKRGDPDWLAWIWFNENADALIAGYAKTCGTDIYKLIDRCLDDGTTFKDLFDGFKMFFRERKRAFMEKASKQLEDVNSSLRVRGKTPQSHGGVANLLKVLTKTMHDQGSSVYTIAKVQYAVCMQAGIMIPSEFLTDVLVAREIIDGKEV